jgi:hypothetical protein
MDTFFRSSIPSALVATFAAGIIYVLAQAVHRLYLSPIAGFPGPKLAAMSFW